MPSSNPYLKLESTYNHEPRDIESYGYHSIRITIHWGKWDDLWAQRKVVLIGKLVEEWANGLPDMLEKLKYD